ncbi:two-component sensor histidine kinase [Planobispora rosea]|uniref:histidine kinase n=1 Tax=Planobispora rosea TaxID=35762 RepID=A0A8J3WGB2_PLARO|nr:histidine kinase [Planobispora rosea]GGT07281.1 two-component sensor histidine kinase [Planobispora rosea]GIH89119.1 two-component sensor histidine kinase [Planobispora rosea]
MTQHVTEYRWLLPGGLRDAPPKERPRVRRSTRDWIVDTVIFLLAAGIGLLAAVEIQGNLDLPKPVRIADQLIGVVSCASVWLRRRWPVGLALALVPVSLVSEVGGGAGVAALFTVAVHRPFKHAALVAGLNMATVPVYLVMRPDPELSFRAGLAVMILALLVVTIWGMLVRARRQLVVSLHERAERAETEAELRVEGARRLERERIAREMHDVLAHRLSLLSVHAGALEYRPDMPPDDVAKAAEVIRSGAHQALQDLREVIGVLRLGAEETVPDRPQPTLSDLTGLAEESRAAGMDVTLDLKVTGKEEVPARLGRNAYRIAQEGLTNARKHAAAAPVSMVVAGGPGDGLTVEIHNPMTEGQAIPGSGTGLIGLTERAELMGGRLEYGRAPDGRFRLSAWLPWAA